MSIATIALFMLAEAAGPPTTADEPAVVPISPAPASEPASGAPPSPALPSAASEAPPLSPRSAETIDQAAPARPPAPPPPVRPSAAFGLELGYAHGGDRFLTVVGPTPGATNGSNAGDGMFFSLAGSWTPYWSTRGVGLGVFARLGVKVSGASNEMGSMTFLRCPIATGLQVLFPVGGRWFALGRLGAMTEVLGQLTSTTSDGVQRSNTNFSPTLGEFIDAGVLWAPADFASFAAIARYERLDVSHSGDVMNANNLGALAAAYLRF